MLRVDAFGTGTDYGSTIFYLPENATILKRFEEFYAIQNEKDSTKSYFFWITPDGEKYPLPKKSVKNMLKTMLNRQILDILREHKTI
ncbi:MAG: hypothetical protein K6F54_03320 [Lachnospiraceae bacterium]|nr:hypothetical protein [Lachnospiraceae bacterium]